MLMCISFFWRNLREKDKLEGLGVDETTILKCIFKKWNGKGVNWIDLAQDRASGLLL